MENTGHYRGLGGRNEVLHLQRHVPSFVSAEVPLELQVVVDY